MSDTKRFDGVNADLLAWARDVNAKRFAAKPIADKIVQMLEARERGELKRTADHFLSGLVRAYGLVVGIDDVDDALVDATRIARLRDEALVDAARSHDRNDHHEPELPASWHWNGVRHV